MPLVHGAIAGAAAGAGFEALKNLFKPGEAAAGALGEVVKKAFEAEPGKYKGEKGDKGDAGEKGSTGLRGEEGDTGPEGPRGDTGDDGQPGLRGYYGASTFTWAKATPVPRVLQASRATLDFKAPLATQAVPAPRVRLGFKGPRDPRAILAPKVTPEQTQAMNR